MSVLDNITNPKDTSITGEAASLNLPPRYASNAWSQKLIAHLLIEEKVSFRKVEDPHVAERSGEKFLEIDPSSGSYLNRLALGISKVIPGCRVWISDSADINPGYVPTERAIIISPKDAFSLGKSNFQASGVLIHELDHAKDAHASERGDARGMLLSMVTHYSSFETMAAHIKTGSETISPLDLPIDLSLFEKRLYEAYGKKFTIGECTAYWAEAKHYAAHISGAESKEVRDALIVNAAMCAAYANCCWQLTAGAILQYPDSLPEPLRLAFEKEKEKYLHERTIFWDGLTPHYWKLVGDGFQNATGDFPIPADLIWVDGREIEHS